MNTPDNYEIVLSGPAKLGDMHHVGNTAGTDYPIWEPITKPMNGADYSGFSALIRPLYGEAV